MTVYFNAYFAPCWVTAHLYTLFQKYSTLDGTQKSILVIAHIVMIVVEIVRLYLGFVGNLSENGSDSVYFLYFNKRSIVHVLGTKAGWLLDYNTDVTISHDDLSEYQF
ncbi:hypothetical protein Tsp_11559 [Trichinella spiralis]|uniref:transmembrane protein 17 n=1 Tax=Trichinella spiralis TaxID=6334 RepID=UPI0001EFDA6A|nr:transmembrane protein 17 [Trichinella spiralis]XP_003373147.1 hypothetical protein Tsp_11559 [Trichinella spiralis]